MVFVAGKCFGGATRHRVDYIVGLAKNARLTRQVQSLIDEAAQTYDETALPVRRFTDITHGVKTWDRARRVIAKVEHMRQGSNPRFVVTRLTGDGKTVEFQSYKFGRV